jgi:predicted metal-binding protein
MEQLAPYLKFALDRGITDAIVVETARVVTAPWVRLKCQFGCAGYGDRLCCPPYTPNWEETRKVLDSYRYGLLFHLHFAKDYKNITDFNAILVELERTLFLDGFYRAWTMGSGPCRLCKECNISGPCVHADKARPSMESCGIDVFATARQHNLPIEVVRNHSQARDTYGLVLVE